MEGEALAVFLGLFVTFIVVLVFISVFVKIARAEKEKKRMEEYKRKKTEKSASFESDEERRRQEELKMRLAKKYGLLGYESPKDEKAKKHEKHVEDAHDHGHVGEEEHYEEIVGSLGEVNDEGCSDLSGVRFIANDLAYEIQSQESVNYDRLAQAMVLGEIINEPRFKLPYTRRK